MNYKTTCRIFTTAFGKCAIIFRQAGKSIKIIRIFVSPKKGTIEDVITASFPDVVEGNHKSIEKLINGIQEYFNGKKLSFSLNLLDLSVCKSFQLKVLRVERTIPYGKAASYGWIARKLNSKAYQGVGTGLSTNPFPIIIPCHRAIKSNRDVGEYQGGKTMKRMLLELEGVRFDHDGKVAKEDFLDFCEGNNDCG